MRNQTPTIALVLTLAAVASIQAQAKKPARPVVYDKASSRLIKLLELPGHREFTAR